MKRKLFTLCMALLLVSGQVFAASGKCGANLKWSLDGNGVLTITGKGAMYDFDPADASKNAPWYPHKEAITFLKIKEGITSIGDFAFYGCVNFTSVTIPNSVTSIGDRAFASCDGLTSIIIGNGVTSIGNGIFASSKGITNIKVVEGNTIYDSRNNCNAIIETATNTLIAGCQNTIIPNNITSIGDYAFFGCVNFTSVTIPNSVTSIGNFAFSMCPRLTSITIPDNVKSIGDRAFTFCDGLTSIIIGNGVTSIGNGIFASSKGITNIKVVEGNTIYDSRNNCNAIIETATNTLIAGCQNTIIPNNITSIGESAFQGCSNLTSVTIPNSVTSIGSTAFGGCHGLTSVTIPNSVTSIGESAFWSSNLTSVTIPNSVTSIGDNTFGWCTHLISVTIGNNVSSIENNAFQYCKNLKELKYPQGLDLSNIKIPSTTKLIAYEPEVSPNQFPLLALVDKSLMFVDESKNNRIEATEECSIRFKIKNSGKGIARDCIARISVSGSSSGIQVKNVSIPKIAVGNTYEVVIPISSDNNTQDGKVTFSIEVYEPNGFGIAPFNLAVATKAYDPPFLQVVDYNIASNSGKIRKMEPFTLTFNLQNTKYGNAENVKVKINLPQNIYIVEGEKELSFPYIQSGEVVNVQVSLLANNNYSTTNIPITIDVKEKYGRYAENKQLAIALNQTASSTINIAAKEETEQERKEIQLAMMTSDVDRNIPVTNNKNPNTFVLIIANEHYQQVAAVPYALNDGNVFKEYCLKTLGVSEKHVHYIPDATINHIKAQVNWLANITETWDDPQVIVYYAGHGIPDEASKSAYLLPVDGSGTDVSTGYKLDELYATLGNMPASRITVFMDACFSGSKREDGMLASARGVALKAKSGVPQGKMVVFSAAQGDETAYPYREQQHGMFTYHLLKKLQETSGDVTLQELGNYIIREVKKRSLEENDKKQTPCVTPSSEVGTEWENWKLK